MAPSKRTKGKAPPQTCSKKNATRKGQQLFRYTQEQMEAAISDVRDGMSVKKSSIKNEVPRTTLLDKINKKSPPIRKMGPDSMLSSENEQIIVNWIVGCARMNFPVTKTILLDSVQKFVVKHRMDNTVFKKGRPGRKWLKNFLTRHPEVSLRTAQNLTQSRAAVTEEDIQTWGEGVSSYLKEKGLESILKEPDRVFNCDETAMFLNPKDNLVFASKGDKQVYQQVNSDEKECLTVLLTVNAAGIQAPPLVVMKYERIPDVIAASIPPEWGVGKSPESGWMNAATFYEFIVNVFHPWLSRNGVERPVILFMDGHSSHVSLHTSLFCSDNGIILVTLYPNSTHLSQPLDVSVFRSLKQKWKSAVHEWRFKNMDSPVLKKKNFCPLLKNVLADIPSSAIINGFRTCGLVPWDPAVVIARIRKHKTLPTNKSLSRDENTTRNIQAHWTALKILEKTIGKEKVEMFRKTQDQEGWIESTTDMALFEAWKEIQGIVFRAGDIDAGCDEDERLEVEPSLMSGERQQVSDPTPHAPGPSMASTGPHVSMEPTPSTSKAQLDIPAALVHRQEPRTSSAVLPVEVPSPFKYAKFFPEKLELAQLEKRKKKALIPDVVTAESWQEYHRKKILKKKEDTEAKKKRADERQQKKQALELLKKEREKKKQEKIDTKNIKKTKCKSSKNPRTKKAKAARKQNQSSSREEEEWNPSDDSEFLDDVLEVDSLELNNAEPHQSLLENRLQNDAPDSPATQHDYDDIRNSSELDNACNELLEKVTVLQHQASDEQEINHEYGIANGDMVQINSSDVRRKIFQVTSISEDSFIGLPLVPVHEGSNIFKKELGQAQLVFLFQVDKKLPTPLILDEQRSRFLFSENQD